MARVETTEVSDSDNEAVSSTKNKSTNGKKVSMAPEDDVSEEQVGDGSDEGSADGSEYEIESIVSAQRNGSGFSYLVSWKGYGEEHNSWVDDKDAGNANDLIAEYWAKRSKEKKGRKSVDKPKSASKAGRKSAARDTSVEVSSTKKRARSKAKKDGSDVEEDSDRGRPKTAKKSRKSTGAKSSSSAMVMDVDNDIGDMEKYMHHESWEKLIKSVDTVEKGSDDKLYVFFTLKTDNERHRQPSEVCKQRFPLHLIQFYEGHLRWKMVDEADIDA